MRKKVLLINPWIHDFAAYDLWLKPLALLYLASIFRKMDLEIGLVDCLERLQKPAERIQERVYGCRKFEKREIEKPKVYKSIPRKYSRYGISLEDFRSRLMNFGKPDIVVVTSMMTYWYEGVIEAIRVARQVFENVPVMLGGKYPEICYEHARKYSGADFICRSKGLKDGANEILAVLGFEERVESDFAQKSFPYPAWEFYENLRYVCILTSLGCPFKCTYCFTPISGQKFIGRGPQDVADEIEFFSKEYGVKNFAFYDDALNYQAKERFVPLLEEVAKRGLKIFLHAPNALSARWMDAETASLMYESGFKTVRLGFETSDDERQRKMGGKIFKDEFDRTVEFLKEAGFGFGELGAYILAGIPGQTYSELISDIDYIFALGVRPYIAEYSPIPGTPLFEEARRKSNFDLVSEPLYQNNSVMSLVNPDFPHEYLEKAKDHIAIRRGEFRVPIHGTQ